MKTEETNKISNPTAKLIIILIFVLICLLASCTVLGIFTYKLSEKTNTLMSEQKVSSSKIDSLIKLNNNNAITGKDSMRDSLLADNHKDRDLVLDEMKNVLGQMKDLFIDLKKINKINSNKQNEQNDLNTKKIRGDLDFYNTDDSGKTIKK